MLKCRGPVSRRSFLQLGGGAMGLGLAQLLQRQALSGEVNSEDPACIFIWLPGGPPHLEMYDLKPQAPTEFRGEFRPIRTNVPGIDICELFPQQARVADKFSLIRSVHHTFADHGGGHKRFMTGRDPKEPTGFVNDYPACGSMINYALRQNPSTRSTPGLNYVLMTDRGRAHIDVYSLGAAYLSAANGPFTIEGDPCANDFEIQNLSLSAQTENRLLDRRRLLASVDRIAHAMDTADQFGALDDLNLQVANLLTKGPIRAAFDLSVESDATKARYGHHAWGYRALMARRLVEAGCPFVTVVWENPYVSGVPFLHEGTYNWDSHAVNCHLFRDARIRFPIYDQAVSALIEDLYLRGLDRRVLLVVTGEFGRTPRIEHRPGTQTKISQPGRDHWPQAMSMLISGGGLRMGQVVGSTNARGEEPLDRPLSPNDVWATIFRHLGIDYSQNLRDHRGRPMPMLAEGQPIAELV